MAGRRGRTALGALLLATVIGTTAAAPGPAPAGAQTTPVPRKVGEIVVDDAAGHVFVTAGDTVTVHDLDGVLVRTITGQTAVSDLVLHDGTVYVLAGGAERITAIDSTTLEVTGGWDLGVDLATSLGWADGRLWFVHGYQWGDLGSLDPVTGAVVPVAVSTVRAGAELQGYGDHLYVLPRGLQPSTLWAYDVSGATPVAVDATPHTLSCSNGRDLALSLDGTTAWTACGSPYRIDQWDLADLSAPSGSLGIGAYPSGIATTAGGYRVGAATCCGDTGVLLYEPGATSKVESAPIPGDHSAGMVAGSAGGDRLYVGTQDGLLHTVRLDPVVTSVAPTPVDRGATVTVTGTGLDDVATATIGGVAAPITPVSATSLRLTVPAAVANGTHPLLLTSRWGDSADTPASVRVFGPEAPRAPARPTVTPTGPHSATVSWPALDGDSWPATSYEVTLRAAGPVVATATVTERSATFTGLRAEIAHEARVVAVNALGRSAASSAATFTPAGPDVAPFARISELVRQQFVDLLGRAPQLAEEELWVERLRHGTHVPGDVVAGLRTSSDHVAVVDPVTRLYLASFARLPEPAGLDYWTMRRRSGTPLQQVAQHFVASAELRALYGSLDHEAFVRRVYRNVLGRDGDPAGIAYGTAELEAGRRTRASVLVGFSESAEHRRRRAADTTVAVLWAGLLRRRPTAQELTTTVERLDGGTPVATIAAEILASSEYHARWR